MVGAETTWVVRGPAYELVARSKADAAVLKPRLDAQAAVVTRLFPNDTGLHVVATVRRLAAPDKPFIAAPPLPPNATAAVVDLSIPDPTAKPDKKSSGGRGRGGPPGGFGAPQGGDPTRTMTRAWLAEHAGRVTGKPATFPERRGEAADPRIAAWAYEAVAGLADSAMVDRYTTQLAAHEETLIPLSKYFTMDAPAFVPMADAGRGRSGGGAPGGGGMGGGRGGMGGGRGGMGGGRGGMGGGRGGMGGMGGGGMRGGGTPGVPRESAGREELQGAALFRAQSAVLAKYLTRNGEDLIPALIDAPLTGKTVDDVFAAHKLGSTREADADWRSWLSERASVLAQHK